MKSAASSPAIVALLVLAPLLPALLVVVAGRWPGWRERLRARRVAACKGWRSSWQDVRARRRRFL